MNKSIVTKVDLGEVDKLACMHITSIKSKCADTNLLLIVNPYD